MVDTRVTAIQCLLPTALAWKVKQSAVSVRLFVPTLPFEPTDIWTSVFCVWQCVSHDHSSSAIKGQDHRFCFRALDQAGLSSAFKRTWIYRFVSHGIVESWLEAVATAVLSSDCVYRSTIPSRCVPAAATQLTRRTSNACRIANNGLLVNPLAPPTLAVYHGISHAAKLASE